MTEANDITEMADPNDPFHGDYTYRRDIPSADDADRRVVRWAQTRFPLALAPLTSAAALYSHYAATPAMAFSLEVVVAPLVPPNSCGTSP